MLPPIKIARSTPTLIPTTCLRYVRSQLNTTLLSSSTCCVVVMFKSRGLGSGWFRAWSGSWSLVGLLWLIRVFPLTDILTLLRILQHLLLLCFSLFSFGSLGRNFLQRLPPQPKSFRIFIFLFTVCFSGCSFCS